MSDSFLPFDQHQILVHTSLFDGVVYTVVRSTPSGTPRLHLSLLEDLGTPEELHLYSTMRRKLYCLHMAKKV